MSMQPLIKILRWPQHQLLLGTRRDFFLRDSALVLKGVSDPETMEEIACREGLALASDLGLSAVGK